MPTKIEWCDETWNPVTGCKPISEGCQNCYAKRMFGRKLWGYDFTPGTLHKDRLKQPAKWKTPKRIFTVSMGDLACECDSDVENFIDVWGVIRNCPWHTFIILTKRPQRLRQLWELVGDVLPNVWMGVTAENQARFDERVHWLLLIPAVVRFVSIEPMLGPVNACAGWWHMERDGGDRRQPEDSIHWVIAGPETGPGARPCKNRWLENLYLDCCGANVPFFLKKHANGQPSNLKEWPAT